METINRESAIEVIVNEAMKTMFNYGTGRDMARDILKEGHRGYNDYTNEELMIEMKVATGKEYKVM